MSFLMGLFIIVLAGMALGGITEIAKAISRRGGSASELAQLKHQLEQVMQELEDARIGAGEQATQLAELQERVDFAERLLMQVRERGVLGAGSDPK